MFSSFLLMFFTINASPDINSRVSFRNLINQYASVFDGQTRSSLCTQWDDVNGVFLRNFSFKVIDNADEYKDSFFFEMSSENNHIINTLVAYEGHNNYELGDLKVTEDQDYKVYRHIFNGYYIDELRLEINKKTNGVKIDFYKSLHGDLLQSLECSPTIGI